MRRRQFITLLGGTMAWPAGRAQQPKRMRRIGVLIDLSPSNALGKQRHAEIREALKQLGWVDGSNVHLEVRWAESPWEAGKCATELVAFAPDAILAVGSISLGPLWQSTSTIPIVFTLAGAGFGVSPSEGGNVTGCVMYDTAWPTKWLELLKEIAPSVTRAGVLRDYYDALVGEGIHRFLLIQVMSQLIGGEVISIDLGNATEIESGISEFARSPNGGLIVTAGPKSWDARDEIIALTARNKLPAVYVDRSFAEAGGLISYGPNFADEVRRSAAYVDRVLHGEKPAELPIRAPKKFDLAINLKTARTLGLNVPASVLSRADEVIG
jgi:putative tryptophan/tyrosine transport system substrate-binding protein